MQIYKRTRLPPAALANRPTDLKFWVSANLLKLKNNKSKAITAARPAILIFMTSIWASRSLYAPQRHLRLILKSPRGHLPAFLKIRIKLCRCTHLIAHMYVSVLICHSFILFIGFYLEVINIFPLHIFSFSVLLLLLLYSFSFTTLLFLLLLISFYVL